MRFLTTKQISGEIEGILRSANEFIMLVSPYLSVSDMYIERLVEAGKKNIKIDLVFGKKKDISTSEEEKLTAIKNLNVHYLEMLHAKCYLNEKDAVITSMNLYEYSEKNREMGIYISKEENSKLYSEVLNEALSIKQNAVRHYLNGANSVKENHAVYNNGRQGYCIRCHASIDFDPTRPFCSFCYRTWAEFSNINFQENFCHVCGREANTSMKKTMCGSCFRTF
ncbi:MAG: hypothetical protein A2509_02250 [Candidatus Edwardsbacteria bacterium RIFOXYD12_FULL_50_11]|uniref:Phospholipase D-like domain-containing protein n=1 Tax=Candidatus Edwardsbacteria bacterium GWF2_54_11 TaxID=1817851 RepID=A0A1F5RGC9_9BACT|nr:MAG: hypothetical protein A2502_06115 [Candidatus Edwardsbacteria bacterium RifOxyC12_full_54_24]OGF07116.1 MAG: hypothetical protein A2273_09315 [Candidatus Edwardsbacteria bacterium RifOxyA12_full_54_48]OGF10918.1 MAG: hypothetical protein A3K15_07195 [Candidatus Edwardsbacteria bacterium GWE2_54_12]OGF13557.1 MAG: hypothetical protein A2024_07170 [Candidatus Edwardsbacteria bacterium GWF2_54_11]OGF15864.1 MAG: hypothetical protein A2509_02250 [Candidatus Edwardsbacteria bacterium RIFOXYD1